jgi:hypothetical protein
LATHPRADDPACRSQKSRRPAGSAEQQFGREVKRRAADEQRDQPCKTNAYDQA